MENEQIKFTWGSVRSIVWIIGIAFAVFLFIWNPLTESRQDIAVMQEKIDKMLNNDLQHIDARLSIIEQQMLKLIENQGKILGALDIKE